MSNSPGPSVRCSPPRTAGMVSCVRSAASESKAARGSAPRAKPHSLCCLHHAKNSSSCSSKPRDWSISTVSVGIEGSTAPSRTIARKRCGYMPAYSAPRNVPYEKPIYEICDSPSAARIASMSRAAVRGRNERQLRAAALLARVVERARRRDVRGHTRRVVRVAIHRVERVETVEALHGRALADAARIPRHDVECIQDFGVENAARRAQEVDAGSTRTAGIGQQYALARAGCRTARQRERDLRAVGVRRIEGHGQRSALDLAAGRPLDRPDAFGLQRR